VQSSLSLNSTASSPESATVDLSGRCVGNSYVLICPVGQGATGTVWRGIERTSGDQVAVKLLHEGLMRQPKLVTRFVQERTIMMMVRHENIVGVRDLFSVGESLGLVMDFVAGGSLRERLRASGTLVPAEAADLTAQVAAALTEAHGLGVVHRDVKPDNILLDLTGGRPEVRLTDFGIARVFAGAGLTTPHAIIGTPHYMAPESIGGEEASPAADVYALGIVLFELISGRTPFAGEPLAVLRQHVDETPQRPAGMPDAAWDVIESCVDKDPARRPPAAELVGTLRELARRTADVAALPAPAGTTEVTWSQPVAAPAHPSVARPVRRARRNAPRSWVWGRRGMMAVLVAGALAASGWGGYAALQVRDAGGASTAAGAPPTGGGVVPRVAPSAGLGSPAPGPSALGSGMAAGDTLPAPSSAGSAPGSAAGAGIAVSAGPGRVGVSAGPGRAGGSVAFGPWRCGDEYTWDVGHPVLARPCHSLGDAVRVEGYMEAAPGVQADITLTIRDADTDEVVAGPYTCAALMFTDFAGKHTCGPVDLQAPRGGRYVVLEQWQYTARSLLPGGSARGPVFTW
jgi:tRNA A-37 threonylcarbamoyl transferase component Bud32